MTSKIKTQPIHPLCDLFPDISGDEFAALVADIRENGLEEPIACHKGKVIDGKNRQRACVEAAVEPQYVNWHCPKGRDEDAALLAFVVSKNLHRRQLTESQRGMIAARLANMKAGDNQYSDEVAQRCATSQPVIAETFDVSRRTVQQATKVIDAGAASLVKAVETGAVTVNDAAKIVDLPKAQQAKAVAAVEAGEAKTVTQAAKKITGGTPDREPGDDPAEPRHTGTDLLDSLGNNVNGQADIFEHCTAFRSLIQRLGGISGEVENLADTPAGRHLRFAEFQTAIKQAQSLLKFSTPYCITPPLDQAKDADQRSRWKEAKYLVELEYRQLTDRQKKCLTPAK